MRFLLFDKVTALEPGKRIVGLKTITLTESCFNGHFPRKPLFPGPLVIEAMIQLLGWAAISKMEYTTTVVLTALQDVTVPTDLSPGTTLELEGRLMGSNPRGSVGQCWARVDGEVVAEVGRVLYGHVPGADPALLRKRLAYYGGPGA